MSEPVKYAAAPGTAEEREFVPFLRTLIDAAADAIRPYFLAGAAVASKADASPVTQADRGAEEAMRRLIEARYPEHAILGEEFGAKEGRAYRWVLDPVDGTRAFISNCFLFGTLVALERDDGAGFRPILGAIAHPAANVAVIGGGQRCTLYGPGGSERPARVRACARLADATVLTTSHWSSGEQAGGAAIEALIARARLYRTWGDCFGYFALATGGADLMLDPTLAYWDVAAIVPVVEAAGGRITAFNGGDPLAQP
ncbi:MAG TPA: inositol monophosphatase family protein, partial [Burkholderiaceae bacterium]|nr:inositol monophosphatase family protein [Burkholderiaceae bacterium]